MILSLVADTDQHETVLGALPKSVEGHFHFGHVVRNTNLLWKLVNGELAFRIVSHVISFELPFVIVSGLEPSDHRVLVGFFNLMLVRPLVIFGFIHIKRLAFRFQRIIVVA